MTKPIAPKQHGALDYGFMGLLVAGPHLLGLNARARALFAVVGLTQGTLNAFTDHPFALKRLVPFRTHGRLEGASIPVFVLLPILTGAVRDSRARAFFLVAGSTLLTAYVLTDWGAADTNV